MITGSPLKTLILSPNDPGDDTDPLCKLYQALVAGEPPGRLLLMLEGHRPVVTVQGWRAPKSDAHALVRLMNEIGEKVERFTFVLFPLDITRKLAAESDLLDFEFPADIDLTQQKWNVK